MISILSLARQGLIRCYDNLMFLTQWGQVKMDAIFQTSSNAFSWMKMFEFRLELSLNFVSKVPIDNKPASVQIMAWRRPGDKPLSEPMMASLPTHIFVTRPQWVKSVCIAYQQRLDTWVTPAIDQLPEMFLPPMIFLHAHSFKMIRWTIHIWRNVVFGAIVTIACTKECGSGTQVTVSEYVPHDHISTTMT